jgi:predicted ester cyclase
MTLEEKKAIARRLYEEVISRGDLAAADELVAPAFVEHNPLPGIPPGREGFKRFVAMLRAAFPDASFTIEDLFAEGDRAAVRGAVEATHRGPFRGIAPTGKRIRYSAIHILRIPGGQVTERWVEVDLLGLLEQLGAAPAGEQAGT